MVLPSPVYLELRSQFVRFSRPYFERDISLSLIAPLHFIKVKTIVAGEDCDLHMSLTSENDASMFVRCERPHHEHFFFFGRGLLTA